MLETDYDLNIKYLRDKINILATNPDADPLIRLVLPRLRMRLALMRDAQRIYDSSKKKRKR